MCSSTYRSTSSSATDPAASPGLVLVRPGVPPRAFRTAAGSEGWLLAVARAIVSSPAWRELGRASLVVRTDPEPIVGALGRFDERSERRLRGLAIQLTEQLPHLAYWDYATAEEATRQLADRVRATVASRGAGRVRYRAVPRGGHVVLGMLAYLADADQDQLELPVGPDDTVIVVDDVAISGSRLTRYLNAHPTWTDVVIATLAAPAGLAAAMGHDRRVRSFLAARELAELPLQARHGDDAARWRRRWRGRGGDDVRWVGRTEHVVFPWNEPDFGIWNDVTGRVERGWSLVPPEMCLKHRGSLATVTAAGHGDVPNDPAHAILRTPVPPAGRELEPHANVVAGRLDDTVVVGATGWDRCIALEGVAATAWDAIALHGTASAAVASVTATYDVDPATARRDVSALIEGLLDAGAIVPASADGAPRT